MTLEFIDGRDDDGYGHIDIKYNGDTIVSVDAHGNPPTVAVLEASVPEDAFASFRYDEDGDIDIFDL